MLTLITRLIAAPIPNSQLLGQIRGLRSKSSVQNLMLPLADLLGDICWLKGPLLAVVSSVNFHWTKVFCGGSGERIASEPAARSGGIFHRQRRLAIETSRMLGWNQGNAAPASYVIGFRLEVQARCRTDAEAYALRLMSLIGTRNNGPFPGGECWLHQVVPNELPPVDTTMHEILVSTEVFDAESLLDAGEHAAKVIDSLQSAWNGRLVKWSRHDTFNPVLAVGQTCFGRVPPCIP